MRFKKPLLSKTQSRNDRFTENILAARMPLEIEYAATICAPGPFYL
jgi:hypothetical protein